MTNEESFKLMELLIKMEYESDLIMFTLFHCEMGKTIGVSFCDAMHDLNKVR